MKRVPFVFVCLAIAAASYAQQPASTSGSAAEGSTAKAELKDAKGRVVGEVSLRETPRGVLMKVDLRDLEPGVKAFHIHDAGRCEPPTFQSAGPHFNPDKHAHGLLSPSGPHAGDLPNVHVPETGMASIEVLVPGVKLTGGEGALLDANGSAVVVHAKADDYTSDPAGNAGDRIACGVVTR